MRLYGIAEVAAEVGVSPNLVKQWHRRGKLPKPTAVLAMGPVWSGKRIEDWIMHRKAGSSSEGGKDG